MAPIDDTTKHYERDFERDVITRLVRIETRATTAKDQTDDHEARLRKLERSAWSRTGALGVIVFCLTIAGDWLAHHFYLRG